MVVHKALREETTVDLKGHKVAIMVLLRAIMDHQIKAIMVIHRRETTEDLRIRTTTNLLNNHKAYVPRFGSDVLIVSRLTLPSRTSSCLTPT